MPTIGIQPSPVNTQTIGAVLLHQFMKDRFREENLDEQLIVEAEDNLESDIWDYFSTTDEQSTDNQESNSDRVHDETNTDEHEPTFATKPDHTNSSNLLQTTQIRNDSTVNLSGHPHLDNTNISPSVGPLNSTVRRQDLSNDEQFQNITTFNDSSHYSDPNVTITNISNGHRSKHGSFACTTQADSIYHSLNGTNQQPQLTTSRSTIIIDGDNHHIQQASPTTSSCSRQTRNRPDLEHLGSTFRAYGQSLREIADEFSKSPARRLVKDRASRVELRDINKETFLCLLDGLFQGGLSSERIIALLYFCVDVAVRAHSMADKLVVDLLKWTFSYFIDTVCRKVEELGGWEKVLFYHVPSFLISCVAVLAIAGLTMYLRRCLRS